ncbi:hypothetical protein WMF31_22715 [Sorangium sp. So ce1036]
MTTAATLPALDLAPPPRRPAPQPACEVPAGGAKGMPRALLRLEGALVLGAALLAHAHLVIRVNPDPDEGLVGRILLRDRRVVVASPCLARSADNLKEAFPMGKPDELAACIGT